MDAHLLGLDGPRLQSHLHLILGAREQLDGPVLPEPLAVHLEVDGPVIRLDFERDLDSDHGGHLGHGSSRESAGRAGGRAGGGGEGGGSAQPPAR